MKGFYLWLRYWWAGVMLRRATRALVRQAKKDGTVEQARAILGLSLMDRGDPVSMASTIEGLGLLGDPRDVERIVPYLIHDNWYVGAAAAKALGHLGGDTAKSALRACAGNESLDPGVRVAAMKALKRAR